MRLNKYLAACGLGSRRGVEELILSGKVRVNGKVADTLATQVEPADEVVVAGRKLRPQGMLVIAVHKPKGYVCTRSDEKDRRTLYDLLPREFQTLHHIGRLDMDSSGLILLTNDGDLSHRLTHPSKGIEKEYEVTVEEPLDETVVPKVIKGMMTPEGYGKAERAWIIGNYKIGMVLKQGLKRQIRHMLYYCGHEVRRLERVRIGNFYLKGMREGSWKELSKVEIDRLISDANAAANAKPRRTAPAPEGGEDGVDFEAAPQPMRRPAGGPAKKRSARKFIGRTSPRSGPPAEGRRARPSRSASSEGDASGSERRPSPRGEDRPPSARGGERRPSPRGEDRPPSARGGERRPAPRGEDRPPATRGGERRPAPRGEDRPPSAQGGDRPSPTRGRSERPSSPRTGGRGRRPSGRSAPE